jgi:hypothetical protein
MEKENKMSNMSYCRFENTLKDLQDCEDHLDDDKGDLSEEEYRAKQKLLELCKKIADEWM